jgi:hypothetical protein
MKKLSFLTILFLFSCSDATETSIEKSELDKCMNANISIIQNTNTERLKEFPEVLRLPVKIDTNLFISFFTDFEEELINEMTINLSNQDTALEYFKSLQEEGILAEDLVIYFDNDEIIISPVEDEKIMDLQDLLIVFKGEIPETELEKIISSTVRIAGEDEIAKNICWSQGIY